VIGRLDPAVGPQVRPADAGRRQPDDRVRGLDDLRVLALLHPHIAGRMQHNSTHGVSSFTPRRSWRRSGFPDGAASAPALDPWNPGDRASRQGLTAPPSEPPTARRFPSTAAQSRRGDRPGHGQTRGIGLLHAVPAWVHRPPEPAAAATSSSRAATGVGGRRRVNTGGAPRVRSRRPCSASARRRARPRPMPCPSCRSAH
jgi:hypothetical protein